MTACQCTFSTFQQVSIKSKMCWAQTFSCKKNRDYRGVKVESHLTISCQGFRSIWYTNVQWCFRYKTENRRGVKVEGPTSPSGVKDIGALDTHSCILGFWTHCSIGNCQGLDTLMYQIQTETHWGVKSEGLTSLPGVKDSGAFDACQQLLRVKIWQQDLSYYDAMIVNLMMQEKRI